jgi:hypothetical protein
MTQIPFDVVLISGRLAGRWRPVSPGYLNYGTPVLVLLQQVLFSLLQRKQKGNASILLRIHLFLIIDQE